MSALIWVLLFIVLGVCGVFLRPHISPPVRWILAGILGVVFGLLFRFRALPFLREDMIMSGGKLYPTAQWAPAMATFFYLGSAVFLLVGVVWPVIASKSRDLTNR
jgi:hypothetical protein